MSLTFMAKFNADRAGSSCHIHLNVWRDGKNVFEKGGEVFRWFLGGWIAHVPDVMVFYAPTINSYKRYVDASWAPTRLAWSYDNRTAGFRVVGNGESLRIECRLPGADCNPYLALADRKSTRLNSSHLVISYAVFCLKKKKKTILLSLALPPYTKNDDPPSCKL